MSGAHPFLPQVAAQVELLVVGGKGGVGKTSLSSATALLRARAGARVLLVSTDPAHNIGHLWETSVGDEVTRVWTGPDAGWVDAVEIDPARAARDHVRTVGATLREVMPPHLHGEVDKHLALALNSPGTHESALLERLAQLLIEHGPSYDLVVLDTAPSGHTVRLMALPETMTTWAEALLVRRTKAERLAESVRVLDRDDSPGEERDLRIRAALTARKKRYAHLRDLVTDPARCAFVLVLTPETLPVRETVEVAGQLRETGVRVAGMLVNRFSPRGVGEFLDRRREQEDALWFRLRADLPGLPAQRIDLQADEPVGVTGIARLADLLEG